jgi:anti-sigma regulatory factor (Ser/Thr protein kinase)
MPTPSSSALPLTQCPPGPRRFLRLSIAGGPRAPARARAWLQNAAAWLPNELEANLLLLTSELINNSVRHGRVDESDVIDIEVRATADVVRARVSDPGPGFVPRERAGAIDDPGGWGLVLVDRLAERWGVHNDERTSVWFELTRS